MTVETSSTIREAIQRLQRNTLGTAILAVVILGMVMFFMFYYALQVTYLGITFSGQWRVLSFESVCARDVQTCYVSGVLPDLGDRAVTINGLDVVTYSHQFNWNLFSGAAPGDVIEIDYDHAGDLRSLQWRLPHPGLYDRLYRLLGLILVFPFWLAGTIVLLLLYPHDIRWRLLVILYYLLTLWLTAGTLSTYWVLGTVELTTTSALVLMPVFLHLHLLIPSPLLSQRTRRAVIVGAYGFAVVALGLTLFGFIRGAISSLSLFLAIIGSTGLLIYQALGPKFDQPTRSSARLMLAGVAVAFGPSLLFWVVPSLFASVAPGELTTALISITLPAQPFFYIYALYKRSLGNLEFRVSRILAIYSYLVIFLTGFVVVFLIIGQLFGFENQVLTFSLLVSILGIMAAYYFQQPYLRKARLLAYGTAHDPEHIVTVFANAIPKSLNQEALTTLLITEMSPALLIRQSALVILEERTAKTLYASAIEEGRLPQRWADVEQLLTEAGIYRSPELTLPGQYDWVRLVLPVKLGEDVLGVWLFGKRDPDDFYPLPDVNLLATLANQIGVALENIRLIADLRQRADELQVAYDELRELDKLKEEFIQNISHELRTPLTLVQGYVELMREGLLGEVNTEQKEALDIAFDRTLFTVRMVDDIISMQQALAERMEMAPVDMAELAKKSLRMAELAGRKEKISEDGTFRSRHQFELRLKDEIPLVMGARSRLGQVFDNLLGNAIKFSPDGGEIAIEIEPCYHRYDIGQSDLIPLPAIEISVRDQGVGIAASKIEHIWDRFYQADGSSTRQFGGMGLGLSIVKEIVTSHEGFIWAESREGVGSIFRFVLPTQETFARVHQTVHKT